MDRARSCQAHTAVCARRALVLRTVLRRAHLARREAGVYIEFASCTRVSTRMGWMARSVGSTPRRLVRRSDRCPHAARGVSMPGFALLRRIVAPHAVFLAASASLWLLSSPVSAACGGGTLDGSETCDDGNTNGGDGCNATCQVEAGYICTGTPSL